MIEVKRQAERDWAELIAPLRQAGQALGAAGELVRQLDDGVTLWPCVQALDELPACITFHPFAATADWSVDLQREQAHASRAEQLQSWAPELTRRARRRQQISVVDSTAATSPSSATRSLRVVKTDSALPDSPLPGVRSAAHAAARLMPEAGVWSALLAIVQLVDEIETTPEPGGSPTAAPGAPVTAQRHGGKARTGDMPPEAEAAAIAATAVIAPAGRIAAANSTSAAGSEPQPATALLAQYVAELWSGAAAPSSPQSAAARAASRAAVEPAFEARPRAPSLLLPARAPREMPPGLDPEARPADGSSPATAWPANDPGHEDALAERLNRALLEQAWLRGVDLT